MKIEKKHLTSYEVLITLTSEEAQCLRTFMGGIGEHALNHIDQYTIGKYSHDMMRKIACDIYHKVPKE